MLRFIVCPLIAYLMAVPLTSHISLDLRETDWLHLMTYVWWVGSWIVWGLIALFVSILVAKIRSI